MSVGLCCSVAVKIFRFTSRNITELVRSPLLAMNTPQSSFQGSSGADKLSARDEKINILPDYGKDVSVSEALDASANITFTRQCLYGIETKVTHTSIQRRLDDSKDISSRLAALLRRYPKLLHFALTKSEIVLNLDCGYGFCGIAALQLGYSNVIFVDTRADILCEAVWPNIVMNCSDNIASVRCVVSNNWVALSEYLSDPGHNK